MSRLNYLVRELISFVGGPWRATKPCWWACLHHALSIVALCIGACCGNGRSGVMCDSALSSPAFSLICVCYCVYIYRHKHIYARDEANSY